MKILVFLSLAWQLHAGSGKELWTLKETSPTKFEAIYRNAPEIKVPLELTRGKIKVLEWRLLPTRNDIGYLIYDSGQGGTSNPVRIHRAALVDLNSKKVLYDDVWEYVTKDNSFEKPRWLPEEQRVVFEDPNEGRKKEIPLPKR